jgi:cytochrome c-type biogenesis protein CcmE
MSTKDRARWAVAAAIILAVVGWFAYRLTTARSLHTYRLVYATMPDDDEALAAWLRAQPGVSAASVTREGDTLVVRFTVRALGPGGGPDVVGEAGRLGYSGLRSSNTLITGGVTLW